MIAHSYTHESPFASLSDIAGKKITVMGLGLNGGGLETVRFFARHGGKVTVTDMKTREDLAPSVEKILSDPSIPKENVVFHLGNHFMEDFTSADCVVKNPVVNFAKNEFLQAAHGQGIPIESDISIFLRFCKSPIIALSGSKGKPFTAGGIAFALNAAGFKTFLGGNITVSPLSFLHETDESTPVVLELSSWQLADLRGRKLLKPKISVLTKIIHDHQNWYDGMESYVADKKLIYADQDKGDFTLIFDDGNYSRDFAAETKAVVLKYGGEDTGDDGGFLRGNNGCIRFSQQEEICFNEELLVKGTHNRQNLLAAALVLKIFRLPSPQICKILAQYTGIEHRLEYFFKYENSAGIAFEFFNDSAATVPEATLAAIEAFPEIVLIAGGTDKNSQFEPLISALKRCEKVYFLKGSGTDKIKALIGDAGDFPEYSDLQSILRNLHLFLDGFTRPLPVVFSPACTSFGMFNNEFHRGREFKSAVEREFS